MAQFQGMTTDRVTEFLRKIKAECLNDSVATAKKLIELDCSLIHALTLKDATITKYMLDNSYDVNEVNAYNSTPLHEAAWNSDLENIKVLVSRGANVNASNMFGGTPLESLLGHSSNYSREKDEVLQIFINEGVQLTVDSIYHLFCTAKEINIIKRLMEINVDFVTKTRVGFNLLHAIAGNENFDPVEILRGQNLDINATFYECTSLMRAVSVGNVYTVEYLLDQGAEVNIICNNHTALMRPFISIYTRATTKQHVKSIELLLQFGAEPQYENCQEIFDIVVNDKKFALIKPYLAHLALIEELGVKIREDILGKINSYVMFKKYFDFCKQKIEKMKLTVIYHSVTLFKFLTVQEQQIIKFARNDQLLPKLKVILYNKRGSKIYYYNVLRRRLIKAERVVNLRKVAVEIISRIDELQNNAVIIEKIVEYFNMDDLKKMKPL